ncbi:MAG: DUF262 and DUF1524 domain-containing protein [Chloroflexota bacterium]|nr:DUF262 and DUF1524 domain-containing protein [Chloroflexota bacterium]
MQAINRAFTRLINGTIQFTIPVFQRDYSWGPEQCEQLWRDLICTADVGSEQGHFLGSIVYVATGDSAAGFTRWLVIDGQQRLATLTLLLTALRDHISETGWTGGEDSPTVQRISAYFLKNLQESGNRRAKLVLRRADDETLQALIDGIDLPEGRSQSIVEAYELFRDLLKSEDPDRVYRGIVKLEIIDVTLDRHADDPQLVFESLNSTGIDLSQADLIRNFVLMRLPESDQTRMYEQHWRGIESLFRGSGATLDAFVRDYMALRMKATKQIRTDQIYRAFRQESSAFYKEDGGVEGTLQDMVRAAHYYAALNPGRTGAGAPEDTLRNLRRLAPVAAILVTRLYRCHDEVGSLSGDNFRHSIELTESYVFRRAICELETRGYWAVFARIAHRIDQEHAFESLQVELARLGETYRFPSDKEFRKALTEKELYGLRVCWHLLDRLENAGRKEISDTRGYSIEHIMPQNENLPMAWRRMLGPDWRRYHEAWLHRLGNLTLTGYNSTYRDRPFEEKKTIPGGFNESAVRLNRYVREQSQWTAKEMEARGEELADTALRIWPPLHVDKALIREADIREIRELARKRSVDQVQMSETTRQLFDALSEEVKRLGDVVEKANDKSVSYHAPYFFLEVLPRKYELALLLSLDFSELDDPEGIAEDAHEWKFIPNARYEGGVVVHVCEQQDVRAVMPLVRQALNASAAEPPQ